MGIIPPLRRARHGSIWNSLLFGTLFFLVLPTAPSQVLYDLDFGPPEHAANSVVTTGAAPHLVSRVTFGSPRVLSEFGSLHNQPLHFDTAGNQPLFYYDQIELELPDLSAQALEVSFDFTSIGLVGSSNHFSLFLDSQSGPRKVTFRGDGAITIYLPDPYYYRETQIGVFADGEAFRFDLRVDYDQDQWSAFKDDEMLGEWPLGTTEFAEDIRFSYGLSSAYLPPNHTSGVAIDNVLVSVPEPEWLRFVSAAGCLVLLWVHRDTMRPCCRRRQRGRGSTASR